MSAVTARAAAPSATHAHYRRRAPARVAARPRASTDGASKASSSSSSSSSESPSDGPNHVVVVPGFLSGADAYGGMARALEATGWFTSVTVVPITRDMWYPTLLGGDFAPMLDAIEAAVVSIGETNDDADRVTNPRRDLCVVGHSAGGWLARLWMGDAPYANGKVYGGAPRVKTLLTLGTPHTSLEEYPFGRVPERLADVVKTGSVGSNGSSAEGAEGAEGANPTWTAERASASSLSLTNFLYPGAWAAPGVRYVSVRGDAVAAASLGDVATFLAFGTLGDLGTLGTLGEMAACVGAGVSYRTATGASGAAGVLRGDGVAPLDAATLDGSERVTLVGVTHQATSRGDGREEGSRGRWYGSPRVVTAWARRLLEPAPGGEETVFEWEIAGDGTEWTANEKKRLDEGSYDATALASALEAALTGGSDTLENVDVASIAPFAGVDDRRTVSTVSTVSTVTAAGSLLWQCCLAARNRVPGATTIARALLRDAGADPNAGGSHGGGGGDDGDNFFSTSPLWWAASAVEAGAGADALDLVRELIDAGADVDASGRYDGVEGPPLWWAAIAARNGEGEIAVDLARVLIGARASVDVRGGYGPGVVRTSALVLAAQGVPGNGTCAELARVLFVAGARLDAADAAALALYRFGSAVSVVKSEIGAR